LYLSHINAPKRAKAAMAKPLICTPHAPAALFDDAPALAEGLVLGVAELGNTKLQVTLGGHTDGP
jgi:hypothetical protein